jgi:iron complex transport system substrate-binding protein
MTFLNARPRRQGQRYLLLSVLAVPTLAVLAGCGSSDDSATSEASFPATVASEASFPATVAAANGDVTIEEAPDRIVSLSPTATEMLYAIGAGDQVVAVDSNSNYPENAPVTDLSGFQPNTEAIAGYEPDLVVMSNDSNGVLDALTKLGIPVLLEPAAVTLEESYDQERDLGAATGHVTEAEELVTETEQTVEKAVASAPEAVRGMKVYHELNPTYYSATSKTFIGNLYTKFGLINIADEAPNAASAGGYPQLSAEYVVTAAPEVIVLADGTCCGQSAETVGKRPTFSSVPAVRDGRVIVVTDDISSRWGPRVTDFAQELAAALNRS